MNKHNFKYIYIYQRNKKIRVKGVAKRTTRANVKTMRIAMTSINVMAAGILGRMNASSTATMVTITQLYISLVSKTKIDNKKQKKITKHNMTKEVSLDTVRTIFFDSL